MMSPLPSISLAYPLLQQDETNRESIPTSTNFSGDVTAFLLPRHSTQNHLHHSASKNFPPKGTFEHNRCFTQKINFDPKRGSSNSSTSLFCKKTNHNVDKRHKLFGYPLEFKFNKPRKSSSCVQTTIVSSMYTSSEPTNTISSPSGLKPTPLSHVFSRKKYDHL